MDSTVIMNIISKYRDTVKKGRPVDILKIFNSDKDFIPNEHSQDMEEINKSCLVNVDFNLKTNKPKLFLFYNDKGDVIYEGKLWKPNL